MSRPQAYPPMRWRGCSRRCVGCVLAASAMIYVSHRLDEVFEIADRMIVLRDGRVAGEREVAKTTPDETILLIVGREPSQVFRRPPDRQGSPRLALQSVSGGGGRTHRMRDPLWRDRRLGRAAGRGPGKHRAGVVRGLADDRRTRSARRTSYVPSRRRARRWREGSIWSAPTVSANPSCRICRCARICSSIR